MKKIVTVEKALEIAINLLGNRGLGDYIQQVYGSDEMVRCNNCGWKGIEEELKQFSDAKGGGYGCPDCKTDEFLTDIE